MTEQEQRAAIAEFAGKEQLYAVMKGYYYCRPKGHGFTLHIKKAWHTTKQTAEDEIASGGASSIVPVPLPNYPHNRNAIIAVIKAKIVGNLELEKEFLRTLDDVLKRPRGTFWKFQMLLITATAAEYCEALLRAVGKWKDEA